MMSRLVYELFVWQYTSRQRAVWLARPHIRTSTYRTKVVDKADWLGGADAGGDLCVQVYAAGSLAGNLAGDGYVVVLI